MHQEVKMEPSDCGKRMLGKLMVFGNVSCQMLMAVTSWMGIKRIERTETSKEH